jgi:hypothetical protein
MLQALLHQLTLAQLLERQQLAELVIRLLAQLLLQMALLLKLN